MCLQLRYVIFWRKKIVGKAACKMLMKFDYRSLPHLAPQFRFGGSNSQEEKRTISEK